MQGKGRCISVRAAASEGVVAQKILGRPCEDTITITAEWENFGEEDDSMSKGTMMSKFVGYVILKCNIGYTIASNETNVSNVSDIRSCRIHCLMDSRESRCSFTAAIFLPDGGW